MRGGALRVVADGVVAFVGDGGGAEEATGYGKIKARTSRLGRTVVLLGFSGYFRTSLWQGAMCPLPNCHAISMQIAPHAGFPDERRR